MKLDRPSEFLHFLPLLRIKEFYMGNDSFL